MSSSSRSISKMSTLLWIMYVVLLALVFPVSSQLQPMIAEQRMRPKWKQYCTFNNALRCHPTIVAQSASGIVNQGWKIYRSPKTKDYYVGITCPQQCWQNIRVYSNMHTYNGVATLSFYYYIWETKQKEGDRLVPQLRIKGCNNEEVWRSGDNPQSHETGEWLGVVIPIYCSTSFSIIFEGIMSSGGQVIAVDNVALTDGRTFTNVLPQPAISVVHPTLPPNTPVIPSRGTRPAVRPRPPIIRPSRPTHRPPQQPPVTDRTTTAVWTTKPKVLSSTNGTADHVPSTAIEGGSSSGKGNFSAIPKLLVALALCICSLTICIHCIIYRKQKKSHNMKQAGSSMGPAPVSGQLSSCSSVCEIVITDHSRNSWAINRIDNPDLPGPSHGLSVDHLTTNHRPRLATCTLGSKAFNSNLTGVSELRPSGRASSLPSRPTPNIYESIDEVKNGLSSHPSNFFLNLSKRSSFVKKVVHTLELPFRKSHVEKGRGSASLTKERSLSDATAKAEASKNHKRAFRKSNSHSGGIRFFPSSLSSLNSQCDAQPSQKRNNLSPALPKRPLSIVFGKHSSRKPSFRTSLSKSRSHSDVNTAVSGRKLVPSGVSPYSCSKLPNISFQLSDSKPSVHFAKSSAETSPNQSISEEPNETTSSSRMSEHFYHDLDSQFRPTVSANLYHVLDPTSFESSSSSEDEDFDKKRSTVKRNTVLQRTESGYTIVSKSSYNSDFENSVGSSLSNIQALDRVYFRLESLDNSQHDAESEFGARDGLLDHEFDMSCDLQRRSQKYGRRLSDLETTCTLSMYEESGRLLDDTDISSTIDDRPDVLRGVRA